MKKKLVGMLATATLLTMALAGNVQAAEIRSVGPDGEAAVDASTIELTDDQIAQIKEGGYTAAICLHYGGNDWSTSQQKGLEDTFGELGIEIVAVTDANFSAETQVSNIETVMAKKPDILVSIPTDATATADAYKQAAAAGIKIVFMDQRGGGAQMPYDQGVAEAKLAALALLGEETPSYVAVPAETVTHENVLEAYTDVYHVETPDWLKEAYVE